MKLQKKAWYFIIGGFLALVMVFGAAGIFAQTDGEGSDVAEPVAQTDEGQTDEDQTDEGNGDETPPVGPGWGRDGRRGFGGPTDRMTGENERLAEALGISVEELQAAHEAARVAAIEAAVVDGLLTQEQADQLLSEPGGLRGHFGHGFAGPMNHETYLAEALGISVEDLQAVHADMRAEKLAELVESGALTQEQVDLMTARQAVQGYIDVEALSETIQGAYETAVEQALADGVITQAQADELLENPMGFGRFGGRGFSGGRGFPGRHPGGFRGGPRPDGFPGNFQPPVTEPASNA